jgi:G3E family GTPase
LFGLGALRRAMAPDHAITWLAQPAPDPLAGLSGLSLPKKGPLVDLGAPSHHASDDRIATASITLDAPIPAQIFDFWLDTLMALKGTDLLRMKGIVHVEGVPKPFVFHAVQHIVDAPVLLDNWPEGDTTSRVVVIARDIPKSDLQDCLAMLRMRPPVDKAAGVLVAHGQEWPF